MKEYKDPHPIGYVIVFVMRMVVVMTIALISTGLAWLIDQSLGAEAAFPEPSDQ
jgi:hypothetical protein